MKALLILCISAGSLAAQQPYAPSHKTPNGRQILAVYLGAQTCGPCLLPEVKDAVIRMKSLVAEQAKKSNAAFAAIGASSDWQSDVGARFLEDVGPFDQVVLGGNWTNLAFERFVWRLPGGESGMPQILILERTVDAGSRRITFSEVKVVRRLMGAPEITAWVAKGAPIAQ